MRFYEVAESRAVDELDPTILLGFDPASRLNHDVVTRMPRRAPFSSMAPTSSRM
jgi:hypothetical protein